MVNDVVPNSYIIYVVGDVEPNMIENIQKEITDAGGEITYVYRSTIK